MKVRIDSVSAPASSIAVRYNSKCEAYVPSDSRSLSSLNTISLINRRVAASPRGIHGVSVQVSARCKAFSKHMKSQTANTCVSIKVRTWSNEEIAEYI